ncbi:RDD family protein [Actinomadura macrotermitis]|uniref:RDD domain-containing protein n=1 Tax=Actinomadura macrotermitis TaxID=2585200 RepID=A0A7K0C6Y4_9ACTN|nr:RDD family protein [Actinomadura macrotermitis]MQY09195.1 hypothetical protein [Actinomadura macrotermitis]
MYGPPPPALPYAAPPPPPAPGDGEAAPRARRFAAWAIDAALLAAVAVLLGGMTWGRLHEHFVEHAPLRALQAVAGLAGSGGDVRAAAGDVGGDLWGALVTDIEQALLLLVLAELVYQFAALAWTGRTLGKAAMDIRVRAPHRDARGIGMARAARRALITTATGTGLYAFAWILLLEGLFLFSVLLWLAAVAAFVVNAVPTLAGTRRRSIADVAGGTVVVRARTYQRAAAAAQRLARDNAALLAQNEHARQVQDAGRRIGGRLKGAYQERRALPPPGQHPGYAPPQQIHPAPPQQIRPPEQPWR